MVCFRFRFKSSFQKFMVISITGLVSACGGGGGGGGLYSEKYWD